MRKIICVLLFLFPFSVIATEFKDVTWHRCYDGDTCTYTIANVPDFFWLQNPCPS